MKAFLAVGVASVACFCAPCPAVCPSDLDGDCQIAASDIAILLGWWGAPGLNGSGAYADLDQDGLVGASDLAVLLGAWGACSEGCLACDSPCAPAGSAGFAGQEAMAGSNDSMSPEAMLATGLAALGFESVQQFNAWSETASSAAIAAATETLAQVFFSVVQEGGES